MARLYAEPAHRDGPTSRMQTTGRLRGIPSVPRSVRRRGVEARNNDAYHRRYAARLLMPRC